MDRSNVLDDEVRGFRDQLPRNLEGRDFASDVIRVLPADWEPDRAGIFRLVVAIEAALAAAQRGPKLDNFINRLADAEAQVGDRLTDPVPLDVGAARLNGDDSFIRQPAKPAGDVVGIEHREPPRSETGTLDLVALLGPLPQLVTQTVRNPSREDWLRRAAAIHCAVEHRVRNWRFPCQACVEKLRKSFEVA